MFYQIFFAPQVKRCEIITYKHGICKLPHELLNNLRLRILNFSCSVLFGTETRVSRKYFLNDCRSAFLVNFIDPNKQLSNVKFAFKFLNCGGTSV